jgi:hypothetical protein
VKTFREWNAYDGTTGVKGYIATGMDDLKYQLQQDIDQALPRDTHHKAHASANEMHKLSQNFVLEMCSWMDAFYQELILTSEAMEEEA